MMNLITKKGKLMRMTTFCDLCNKIINGSFGGGETFIIDTDTHEMKNYHENCYKEWRV